MIKKIFKIIGISLILFIIGFFSFAVIYDSNTISVRYGGGINIFLYNKYDTSRSSFIEKAYYNSRKDYLILNLNGTNYQYCGVPKDIWKNFKKAGSLGSYYNYKIKGEYFCPDLNLTYMPRISGGYSIDDQKEYVYKNIKYFPNYSPGHISCINEAFVFEEKILKSLDYTEQRDGLWKDRNGLHPDYDAMDETNYIAREIIWECF